MVTTTSIASTTAPVICLDSGVGGLHIFEALSKSIPAPLIYIADAAGFPYGSTSPEVLCTRLIALVQQLHLSVRPSLIVLACNTATAVAIDILRVVFPNIPFVGCIPAVKPAARASQSKTIALLATPATCKQNSLDELIRQHANDCTVLRFPLPDLAKMAEDYFVDETNLCPSALNQALSPLLQHPHAQHIDQIVLGCTHYKYLLSHLQALGHDKWAWVDSTEAVASQAYRLWLGNPLHSSIPDNVSADYLRTFFYTVEAKENIPPAQYPSLERGLKRLGLANIQPAPWRWLKHRLRLSSTSPNAYAHHQDAAHHTVHA